MTRMFVVLLMCSCLSGCTVSLSFFVEKDWRTDPHIYTNNDVQSKVQLEFKREFK